MSRGPFTHIISDEGFVHYSSVEPESTFDQQPLESRFVGEFLPESQVLHYFHCLDRAIKDGQSICSYNVGKFTMLAKFTRISSNRVQVIEHNVTTMSLEEVLKLV